MKPKVKIAETRTPDGGNMALHQHDQDFIISINGQDLMLSREHESERELARLGCRHLAGCSSPRILVGGLGMGYTLRQALDMLGPNASVVVGELVDALIEWNRMFFGVLNGHPMVDDRVSLERGDVLKIISGAGLRADSRFDAILLDIDNGPAPLTDSGNRRIYGPEGIQACRRALIESGCLAVWSAGPSKKFEQLLMRCGFHGGVSGFPHIREASRSPVLYMWHPNPKSVCRPGAVRLALRRRKRKKQRESEDSP